MIDRNNGTVTIECDGCSTSKTLAETSSHDSKPALDRLLASAAREQWMVNPTTDRVEHLCGDCGRSKPGAIPLGYHIRPDGQFTPGRGSTDVAGTMAGIVSSGQKLSKGQMVAVDENGDLTAFGAPVKRTPKSAARRKDKMRGTPGLSELPDEKKNALRDKLAQGKAAFSISLNLNGDDDNV